MTPMPIAQFHKVKALVQAIEQKRGQVATLTTLVDAARNMAFHDDARRVSATNFLCQPDRLAGVVEFYRRTDTATKEAILRRYHQLLIDMLESPLPGIKPRKVDFAALPREARCYLLAPYLNLVVGGSYPRLDFDHSDPNQYLIFIHTGGPADPAAWRPHLEQISAWLGGSWHLTAQSATTITLTQRQALPAVIPMAPACIKRGALFTGIDTSTYQPTYLALSDMTSGTFIPGASGTGKSNALHILLQSLFANLDLFTHVYLVDGKDGVAFNRYAGRHSKVSVFWEESDLWKLTTELVATMRARNDSQRQAGTDKATKDFIAVVIDEMSTYTAKPSSDGKSEANKAHARFLDELAMLARRGRSTGLRMIITAQEPTDNQIPTTVRNNCQTTIAFRLPIDAHATATFGQLDGLPADPRKLRMGRALIKHGMTGEMQCVQFPVIQQARGRP